MSDIRLVIRDNVKFYRKRLGYTQQQLAEHCGVTTPYIGEIEIGRKTISLTMLETLARVLEVEEWKLLLPAERRHETITLLLANELRESLDKAVDQTLAVWKDSSNVSS